MRKFASQIVDFVKTFTPALNKSAGVYEYGDVYPELVEYLTRNSVTTHTASNLMSQFIVGRGIEELNKQKANDTQTYYELLYDIAKDLTDYRGVYIHRNLTLTGETISLEVLPFSQMRVGKRDDKNYSGKYVRIKSEKEKEEFFAWNENKKVIEKQFETAGDKMNGQVLYISLDRKYIYPFPRIYPVLNDAESEIQASIYKNTSLKKGFFGKHIFITPPFVDKLTSEDDIFELESKREEFKNNLTKFMGVENAGNVLHLEMEFDNVDDIDKLFVHKEIKTNIDDKLFSYTESSVSKNILMAFNNVPELLVRTTDNGIFGNSGELIKQAKIHYQNSTEREREILEGIVKKITGKEYKITPLIDAITN